jgi:hypothetical protein
MPIIQDTTTTALKSLNSSITDVSLSKLVSGFQGSRKLSPGDIILSNALDSMASSSASGTIPLNEVMEKYGLTKLQLGALLNILDRQSNGTHPASTKAMSDFLQLPGRALSIREITSLADSLEKLGVGRGVFVDGIYKADIGTMSTAAGVKNPIVNSMPGAELLGKGQRGIGGKLLKIADVAEMIADVVGIFDPTPCSDVVGGIIALCKGDWIGAGLSVVSIAPGAGDALAKPMKFARHLAKIAEAFPALKWMKHSDALKFIWKAKDLGAAGLEQGFKLLSRCKGNVDKALGIIDSLKSRNLGSRLPEIVGKVANLGDAHQIQQTISKLSKYSDDRFCKCLSILSRQKEEAIAMYRKNQAFAKEIFDAGLPTNGPVVFVPPKGKSSITECKFNGDGGGYVDAHGNIWTKGRGTSGTGAPKEWDVQVAKGSLKPLAGDGKHLNVACNNDRVGVITHIPSVK